jgi:hypothetical protein
VFAEELKGLENLVIQNVSVSVTYPDLVRGITQKTNHPEVCSENTFTCEPGDLFRDEERRVLLTFDVPMLDEFGKTCLGEIEVRYTEVKEDGNLVMKSLKQELYVNVPSEEQAGEKGIRIEILRELAIQESAKARREALEFMEQGDMEKTAYTLIASAEKLKNLPEEIRSPEIDRELTSLTERIEQVEQSKDSFSDLSDVKKSITQETLSMSTKIISMREPGLGKPGHRPDNASLDCIVRKGFLKKQVKTFSLPLRKDEYSIGSSAECDVVLDCSGVRSKHAEIIWKDGEFRLISHVPGKTYLNGLAVDKRILKNGDIIDIGRTRITFRIKT